MPFFEYYVSFNPYLKLLSHQPVGSWQKQVEVISLSTDILTGFPGLSWLWLLLALASLGSGWRGPDRGDEEVIVLAQLQVIHRHHLRGSPRSLLLMTMLCTTGAAEDREDILQVSSESC